MMMTPRALSRSLRGLALLSGMAVLTGVQAQNTVVFGFEPTEGYVTPRAATGGFPANSAHDYPVGATGLDRWSILSYMDQELVPSLGRNGTQGWRWSSTRSTGDIVQSISPRVAIPAGEPGTFAQNGTVPRGASRFIQQFWIRSASNVVERGNRVTISGDDGNGARMNFVSLDVTTGPTPPRYQFRFFDYRATSLSGGPHGFGTGAFVSQVAMDNVVPGEWYHVRIVTDLLPGRNNDRVSVYISQSETFTEADLRMVGTSWEEYYRQGLEQAPQNTKALNSTLFRSGVNPRGFDPAANTTVGGFIFDDFRMESTEFLPTVPVDLNGTYHAPSSGGVADVAWAATGSRGAAGATFAQSSGTSAAEQTFTPFSDANRAPRAMSVPDLANSVTSFRLNLQGIWQAGDAVRIGAESTNSAPNRMQVEVTSVAGLRTFTLSNGVNAPTSVTDTSDATQYQVMLTNAGGTTFARFERLDGSEAGSAFTASLAHGALTEAIYFVEMAGAASSRASATVSTFATSAIPNALYLHADDPFVRTAELAEYRLGMGNMSTGVGGFQAFLSAVGAQTFANGSYTSSPFPAGQLFGPISSSLNLAAGIAPGGSLVSFDAVLANIGFTPTTDGTTSLAIDAGRLGLDTQFTDQNGNLVAATRRDSNRVVRDNVAPVLGALSATQGASNVLVAPGVMQGAMNLSVSASDALAGLASRPTFTLNFAPTANNGTGPEDVTLNAHSAVGNTFAAQFNVLPSTPNGAAEIVVRAIDRAGNEIVQTTPINVNTATLTLQLSLAGNFTGRSFTRGVEIRLGGTGGANSPIVLSRNVNFVDGAATLVFNAADNLPSTALADYRMSAKDTLHTLRRTVTVNQDGGNQYSASISLTSGNLNQDNRVDIADYVVYATRFGASVDPNTPFAGTAISHPATLRHADINGDGAVDGADFTFISTAFATAFDDNEVGMFGRPNNVAFSRISVRDAVREAGTRAAEALDLNRDNWITVQEVQRYLQSR